MKDYVGKVVRQKRPKGKHGECRDTAKITIVKNGVKRVYSLGRWGSPEAEQARKKLMLQYYSDKLPALDNNATIGDFLTYYLEHREPLKFDTRNTHTKKVVNMGYDLLSKERCSDVSINTITIIKERLVREARERNLTKAYVNTSLLVWKKILEFGVINGWFDAAFLPIVKLYPPIKENLKGLKKRTGIEWDTVEATLKYLPQPYVDMVRLIYSACLRPIELLRIRKSDIEVKEDCWVVRVKSKTERYGYERILVFNKYEQELLKKWIKEDDEVLFRTKHGKVCTQDSLRYALFRAINKANKNGENIPYWTSYQLRHAAFTNNVKKYGVEIASKLAGHANLNMARIYDHSTEDILINMAHKR